MIKINHVDDDDDDDAGAVLDFVSGLAFVFVWFRQVSWLRRIFSNDAFAIDR